MHSSGWVRHLFENSVFNVYCLIKGFFTRVAFNWVKVLTFKLSWFVSFIAKLESTCAALILMALFGCTKRDTSWGKPPHSRIAFCKLNNTRMYFRIYCSCNINLSKTTCSGSSYIQTPRSGLKNEAQQSLLRPTLRCVDIGRNTEWSFWYSFSNEQWFWEKFKDRVCKILW